MGITEEHLGSEATTAVVPAVSLLARSSRVRGALEDSPTAASARQPRSVWRSWFALTFSAAFCVKALCIASNVVYQASPFKQVQQFYAKGDTGELDGAPYLSILYGGCQWCFYGLFAFVVTHKSGFLILVYSNCLGAVLGVFYIAGFHRNCRDPAALRKLLTYYQFAGALVILQCGAMVVFPRERALFFCGLVSSTCSFVGACSMLATLPVVLRTRTSRTINVPLLSVGTFSTGLWVVCGIMLRDPWICVPNVLGLCINSVAFALVAKFPEPLADAPPRTPSHHPADAPRATGHRPRPPADEADEADEVLEVLEPQGYGTMPLLGETGGTF